MRAACTRRGSSRAQIGYINAHGTATPVNDGAEAEAYAAFLGDALGATRISSTKAAIGHTLGAAGAIEALFALAALRTGDLPPQLNLQEPIPEIAPALVAPGRKAPGPASCHEREPRLRRLKRRADFFHMNVDLAIIGQGAVTPAGVGVEALCDAEPKPQMVERWASRRWRGPSCAWT